MKLHCCLKNTTDQGVTYSIWVDGSDKIDVFLPLRKNAESDRKATQNEPAKKERRCIWGDSHNRVIGYLLAEDFYWQLGGNHEGIKIYPTPPTVPNPEGKDVVQVSITLEGKLPKSRRDF